LLNPASVTNNLVLLSALSSSASCIQNNSPGIFFICPVSAYSPSILASPDSTSVLDGVLPRVSLIKIQRSGCSLLRSTQSELRKQIRFCKISRALRVGDLKIAQNRASSCTSQKNIVPLHRKG
jgi:hypothetical protein